MNRVMVLWCPDFAVTAGLADLDLSRSVPAAVLHGHRVTVCNESARAHGVRRGMRRRDAQSRCPRLQLLTENSQRDARLFDDILRAVEQHRPGVMAIRPGLLALRAPGRWSTAASGESIADRDAAAELAQVVVECGVWDVRIGIADDLFTAEHAARGAAVQEHRIVPSGSSIDFLHPLPVEVLLSEVQDGPQIEEMVSLLRRLGLFRLGDLARLPAAEVGQRFGAPGARVWRQANGMDPRGVAGRRPPPELTTRVEFDPPLDAVEAICFSARRTAEELIAGLASRNLVATQVRIEAWCPGPGASTDVVVSGRSWIHPRHFTPRDLIDRVHWQLHGQGQGSVRSRRQAGVITEPVTGLRFVPEVVEPTGEHAQTLWGGGAEELVHRGMAKIQAMLGYEAVLVPVVQGGRTPSSRQGWVPWGERVAGLRPVDRPWPGRIPGPAPSRVFPVTIPSGVRDQAGVSVGVDSRGAFSADPAQVLLSGPAVTGQDWTVIRTWAGPWPCDEAWWEDPSRPPAFRCQLITDDGRAWLLRITDRWEIEAAYD